MYLFDAIWIEHDLSGVLIMYLLVHTDVQDVAALIGQEQTNRNTLSRALYPMVENMFNVLFYL